MKTIKKMRPAMASTSTTSMMVKPFLEVIDLCIGNPFVFCML